ncbi:hypothetical protein R3P38DRAFT_3295536 [Favolaschia claudopus]|uniref:Uncharacterized protein n=1 Tax=Favolaschia claudopus TaxID=2862362 RepID=A0AAV9ZB57_9AGAR
MGGGEREEGGLDSIPEEGVPLGCMLIRLRLRHRTPLPRRRRLRTQLPLVLDVSAVVLCRLDLYSSSLPPTPCSPFSLSACTTPAATPTNTPPSTQRRSCAGCSRRRFCGRCGSCWRRQGAWGGLFLGNLWGGTFGCVYRSVNGGKGMIHSWIGRNLRAQSLGLVSMLGCGVLLPCYLLFPTPYLKRNL